jgi:hypothetical protein
MRAMRVPVAIVLAIAGLVAVNCGGITDPSKNTIQPFSGTLPVGGIVPHPFSASKSGEISVKLTALAPTSNGLVGLDWVQAANDGACTSNTYQRNQFAQLNVPAIAGAIPAGKYCIIVYDIGSFAVPQTYTIAVSHP